MAGVVGFTLGDPSGVGPEVMRAAAWATDPDVALRAFVPAPLVETWTASWPAHVTVQAVPAPAAPVTPGTPSLAANAMALAALSAMVDAAVEGALHAMVTGPVAKGIFDGMTPQPPGQTEYVARRLGARQFAMMLAGPRLRVVPVTTHLPLRAVADALTTDAIVGATRAACGDLQRWLGIAAPRVAVCGLNPHAGEGGRLGDEEGRVIAPAVSELQQGWSIDAHGPLPADVVFHQALEGRWDLVVCMYHDQALGPLKTVHFYDGWNQTCGLSVPRLSPDHGTAWDIAGKGVADTRSAVAALSLACRIARSQG